MEVDMIITLIVSFDCGVIVGRVSFIALSDNHPVDLPHTLSPVIDHNYDSTLYCEDNILTDMNNLNTISAPKTRNYNATLQASQLSRTRHRNTLVRPTHIQYTSGLAPH
jgi:hypothetical protein